MGLEDVGCNTREGFLCKFPGGGNYLQKRLHGVLNMKFAPIFRFFSECFAVTAELNNGSIISLKECYIKRNVQDICVNTTACNRAENMTGVSPFKRCEAKCCSTSYCNKYLVPDMIPVHSPTQSGPASTSIAPTAANSTTKASTTEVPASGGTNIEAFCFLSVLLLFGIQMAI